MTLAVGCPWFWSIFRRTDKMSLRRYRRRVSGSSQTVWSFYVSTCQRFWLSFASMPDYTYLCSSIRQNKQLVHHATYPRTTHVADIVPNRLPATDGDPVILDTNAEHPHWSYHIAISKCIWQQGGGQCRLISCIFYRNYRRWGLGNVAWCNVLCPPPKSLLSNNPLTIWISWPLMQYSWWNQEYR